MFQAESAKFLDYYAHSMVSNKRGLHGGARLENP